MNYRELKKNVPYEFHDFIDEVTGGNEPYKKQITIQFMECLDNYNTRRYAEEDLVDAQRELEQAYLDSVAI